MKNLKEKKRAIKLGEFIGDINFFRNMGIEYYPLDIHLMLNGKDFEDSFQLTLMKKILENPKFLDFRYFHYVERYYGDKYGFSCHTGKRKKYSTLPGVNKVEYERN